MRDIFPGEPTFKDILVAEKIDIVRALSFYNTHASDAQVKSWAAAWMKEFGVVADLSTRRIGEISRLAAHWRMRERGLIMSDAEIENISDKFRALHREKAQVQEAKEEAEDAKPKTLVHKGHECLANLNAYVDECVMGTIQSSRAPSLVRNNKEAALVAAECEKQLGRLDEQKEFYDKAVFKAVKAAYLLVLKSLDAIKQKIETAKKSKPVSTKSPVVISKYVRYQKDFLEKRWLTPDKIVGVRKAYIYDSVTRVIHLFEATAQGFTWSGTTLKNIDTAKSSAKRLRKPEDFFKHNFSGIAELNKLYNNCPAKELRHGSGRMNENMVILAYGGF